jgi:hypothetical protein
MWLHKRSRGKSLLAFRIAQSLQEQAVTALDAKNLTYVHRPNGFRMTVDKEMIESNADVFTTLASLVKESWKARTG